MKVLLVDDDRELVDLLTFSVRRAGYTPLTAYDAPSALAVLERDTVDALVLDVNLGAGPTGLDLLRQVRRKWRLPVIMLTAHDSEDDKVQALDLGADDYVTKPFSHRELLARLRVQLRRGLEQADERAAPPAPLVVGPLRLSSADHTATLDGAPLALTVTEFRLLRYLMLQAGTVAPTHALLKHVWGYDDVRDSELVRVAIFRLRKKIEQPERERLLTTVPGVGVMLRAPDTAAAEGKQ